MLEVENYAPALNTIILIFIFWYQMNKNKVLLDRISQQERVLNETKGLISQQSTAIDSQSKVVYTAIKYAEAFSPEKLEKSIRMNIELEQEQLKKVNESFENKDYLELFEAANKLAKIAESSADTSLSLLNEMVEPITITLVMLLQEKTKIERDIFFTKMDVGKGKDLLLNIFSRIDEEIGKH